MADYTEIDNANLEPGAPLISSTMFALRDNAIAIAEGAAGAPRIQAEALGTGSTIRDWVLGRVAAASVGAVGTYALMYYRPIDGPERVPGTPAPGSELRYANIAGSHGADFANGTWRLMGYIDGTTDDIPSKTSLWLRIS